mmetsp:Transcript_85504/g.228001  ORF Transcript_85504/g.228001 Transcript_85504/m.228001 type:complete len:200 (+) Transcript_85504:677-1276(+)
MPTAGTLRLRLRINRPKECSFESKKIRFGTNWWIIQPCSHFKVLEVPPIQLPALPLVLPRAPAWPSTLELPIPVPRNYHVVQPQMAMLRSTNCLRHPNSSERASPPEPSSPSQVRSGFLTCAVVSSSPHPLNDNSDVIFRLHLWERYNAVLGDPRPHAHVPTLRESRGEQQQAHGAGLLGHHDRGQARLLAALTPGRQR